MAFFAGMRGTGSFGTDERPKNFREMILWMNPNGRAPLFALSSKMKKQTTDDPEFAWWEETLDIARVQLNDTTGLSTTETAVTCDNGSALQFVVGDLLQVEKAADTATYDHEIVRVTAVTNATTFTIARGEAGTSAGTIADDAWFLRIGSVSEEGSLSPNVATNNPTKLYNYTQIFKTALQETGTDAATKKRTGDAWKNDKRRKAFVHSEKIEQTWMFGVPYEGTGSGGQPERFTGGLRNFITSNVTAFAADPTIDTFIAAIQNCFDYDAMEAGDERIVFCGNGAINWLNKLVVADSATRINYQGDVDYYGMNLMKFRIPQGTLYFKTHPLMNVHPVYTYSMFVVNPAGLIYRPLQGRDTKFEDNIQPNDADYRKAQWLTECGLEVHHETTMAYIANFKDFA